MAIFCYALPAGIFSTTMLYGHEFPHSNFVKSYQSLEASRIMLFPKSAFKIFFLLFWMLIYINLFSGASFSQQNTGVIKGTVVDIKTRQPIKDVLIKIQNTSAVAISNSKGEFEFTKIPQGVYNLEFIKDKYQTSIIPKQEISPGKTTFVRAEMAGGTGGEEDVFFIGGIEITAKKELLPEKIETVTHIKSSDIEHIQATSLGDVLDLVPGVEMKNQPALKEPVKAQIRDPRSDNSISAFGAKVIIDDIPISNNSNLQGGLLSGVYTGSANGLDLREIPADNIESVEVVRGIAPANHGDYVGGLINVKTKTSMKPTSRLKGKNNPDTKELNWGGSLPLGNTGVNYNINYGYSEQDIRKDYDNTQRLAAQLILDNDLLDEKLAMKNQFKYSTLFEEIHQNPEDPDALESINKGYRFIYGNKMTYQLDPITELMSNLYVNYRRVNSYKQYRRMADNRVTSTLLGEGTEIGIRQYGPYIYRYTTIGDEVSIGHKLEWSRKFFVRSYLHNIEVGNDFQFDDNFGEGKTFDLLYPSSQGDRPRPFDDVPGTFQHSLYFNDQITGHFWREFTLNLGFRLERYTTGSLDELNIFKSKNGSFLNPRINLAYFISKDTQFRLGFGAASKSPSLMHIFPEPYYLDVLDIVPVFRETDTLFVRDSLITTYVFDLSNPDLKGYQEKKVEMSLDHKIGDFGLSLTGFYSQRSDEPTSETVPYLYYKYNRPNWPSSEGESVADTLMDVTRKMVNGGWSKFDGVEFTLKTRRLKKLNMDFRFNATYHHVKSGADGWSWGSVRSDYSIPIYNRTTRWTQKLLLTYQVNYISKPLGIWVSFTAQQVPHYRTQTVGFSDSLAVAYYNGLTNETIRIPEQDRMNPEYENYRLNRNQLDYMTYIYPNKWLFNIRVSKALFKGAEVSLFVNNFLDDRAFYEDQRYPGYYRSRNPEIFYGMEFSMLIDKLF